MEYSFQGYDHSSSSLMSADKKPTYRCPHCLSIKVEQKHFGHECPSCFKQIPVGLTPEYYVTNGKTSSFGKVKSALGKRPSFVKVAIALILATASITAYLDSSKNPYRDLSRIAEGIIPLGAIFQKRLEFEDITNCFDMLKYLQQEGWSMYTYRAFGNNNGEDTGPITNVSTRAELATSLTIRLQKNFSTQDINPVDIGIDCSDIYSEYEAYPFPHKSNSLRPKSIRYSDFVKDLKDREIVNVTIAADRSKALALYKDSQSFIVNLTADRDLLHILTQSGTSIKVIPTTSYDKPLAMCREANAKRIGLFFSGNQEAFKSAKNYMLYLSKEPPWMNKFSQDENPKYCGFSLPSMYLSKGVSSNSYSFFAKISKLTDGSVEFSSSL